MLKPIIVIILGLSLAASPPVLSDSRVIVAPGGGVLMSPKKGTEPPADTFDLTGLGGTSQVEENCQYGNDGITRCDDCDVDWDQNPPAKFCITAAICYDNNGKSIACP